MGVFTFVCRSSGDEWTAKQYSGDLEASAATTFELQRKLVQSALSVDSSGGVQSSFSLISPSSAVFQVPYSNPRLIYFCFLFFYVGFYKAFVFGLVQVIVGGGGGGAFIAGGAAAAAAPAGGAAAAAEAPPAEKKEEEKEESDDDMGFSLFD